MIALVVATTSWAQCFASKVVMQGLDNPRGLAFDAAGALYVTEAGRAEIPAPGTPSITVRGAAIYHGTTGAISKWDGHTQSEVLTGLPSFYNSVNGDVAGPQGIGFSSSGALYFTTGFGANPALRVGPEFNQLGLLMRVPTGSSTPQVPADVAAYEGTQNSAGGPVDSNPYQLQVHGGGVLVADAGANAVLNVKFDGTIDLVRTLSALPAGAEAVPTSLTLGTTGEIYVSQLTGFPFAVGGAIVFRVDNAGLTSVGTGFTNVVDLATGPDGMLYVLELAHRGLLSGDPTGGLWRLNPETGVSTLLMTDGLIFPTALAFADDGTLYIANRGIIPGAGEVVSFQSVPEPAVTGAAAALGLIGLVWWRRRAARRPNESAQFDLIEDRSAVRNVR